MQFLKRWMTGIAAVLACTAGMGAASAAAVEVSGDVGAYSQYVWRAVPQTAGEPAVQGDLAVDIGGGLSAGVWFSNAYATTNGTGVDVDEFDWTLDYSGSAGMLGYSVGGILYSYLYDGHSNFGEAYVGVAADTVAAPSLTVYYTVGDSGNSFYLGGDIWVDLGVGASAGGFDFSGTLSFASWQSDGRVSDDYKDGLTAVALGASKDVTAGDLTFTPSVMVTVPLASESADGFQKIYGGAVDPSFIAGVNVAY